MASILKMIQPWQARLWLSQDGREKSQDVFVGLVWGCFFFLISLYLQIWGKVRYFYSEKANNRCTQLWASLLAQTVKICLQCRRPRFVPWVRKTPWRRAWQPTPVFLPGESHGQRSLVGYRPWSCKESDSTKQLTLCKNGPSPKDSSLLQLKNSFDVCTNSQGQSGMQC